MVELQPGQLIFGRKQAAKELELSERTIRTCLEKLKNLENLTIKATNKFSIITINNWETYQQERPVERPATRPASDQQATSRRPAGDHKQECKEHKNEKKEEEEGSCRPASGSPSPNGIPLKKIVDSWNASIDAHNSPLAKVSKVSPNTQRYKHIRARWSENPSFETWQRLFDRLAQSDFFNGRIKSWMGSFDWLIKSPDNWTKALEGKYDNRGSPEGERELGLTIRELEEIWGREFSNEELWQQWHAGNLKQKPPGPEK
jgi:hypothetical protein